jgi:hypothetical protein
MAKFIYNGESDRTFIDFKDAEKDHVLEVSPGETYEIDANPDESLFEAIAKIVTKEISKDVKSPVIEDTTPSESSN